MRLGVCFSRDCHQPFADAAGISQIENTYIPFRSSMTLIMSAWFLTLLAHVATTMCEDCENTLVQTQTSLLQAPKVAVYLQVGTHNSEIWEDLYTCISNVAKSHTRQVDVFVSTVVDDHGKKRLLLSEFVWRWWCIQSDGSRIEESRSRPRTVFSADFSHWHWRVPGRSEDPYKDKTPLAPVHAPKFVWHAGHCKSSNSVLPNTHWGWHYWAQCLDSDWKGYQISYGKSFLWAPCMRTWATWIPPGVWPREFGCYALVLEGHDE